MMVWHGLASFIVESGFKYFRILMIEFPDANKLFVFEGWVFEEVFCS